MEWSSASPTDRAWTLLGLARAAYLSGELEQARDLIGEVEVTSSGHAPLAEAEALTLAGRTCAAEGRMDDAADYYQQAVLRLSAIGADKAAAQSWFDLAALLESVDLAEAARDAYRRAAASTGLRTRTSATSPVHV